jgi:hypothetical protein
MNGVGSGAQSCELCAVGARAAGGDSDDSSEGMPALDRSDYPAQLAALNDMAGTFDLTIPAKDSAADFFEEYGAAFARNAPFSSAPGLAPALGDLGSPPAAVTAFYAYWFVFTSWRNGAFIGDVYDDVRGGGEKRCRWCFLRQLREKRPLAREEVARVAALVANAHARDPRVRAAAEAERLGREAHAAVRREGGEARARTAADSARAAAAWARSPAGAAERAAREEAARERQRAAAALQKAERVGRHAASQAAKVVVEHPAAASHRRAKELREAARLAAKRDGGGGGGARAAVSGQPAGAPGAASAAPTRVRHLPRLNPEDED